MKMINKTFLLFLLIVILTSCDDFASTPTTNPEMDTAIAKLWTAYAETQTISFSATPSPAQKPTLSPIFSAANETKSAFYTQISGVNQTQKAYMSTEVPGTLAARRVECNEGFVLERGLDLLRYSTTEWTIYTCSPKLENIGDWLTPGLVDYGTRYTQLSKTDFSRTWIIRHSVFDYSIINRPDAWLFPYRWTADGKYLYLFPQYYPSGSGYPEVVVLQSLINDLYRINLETGQFEIILSTDQYGALELSPDDQILVYSDHDKPDIIHIRDMRNGDKRQIRLDENIIAAGAFVWSEDSAKVVITIGYEDANGKRQGDLSETALYVLNPKNMHVQKIHPRDPRKFIPYPCFDGKYWFDKNILCLSSNEGFHTINIRTGEVLILPRLP